MIHRRWCPRAIVFLVLASATLAGVHAEGPRRYSRVAITCSLPDDLRRLGQAGIPLDDIHRRDQSRVELIASAEEIVKLEAIGFPVTILDADVTRSYAHRAAQDMLLHPRQDSSRARNFHLGSLAGNLTLTEIEAEVNAMQSKFPLLISAWNKIGTSVEGRPIWAIKISRNPMDDENEPRILYTALHHAREPGGMMVLFHTMWYLLEQYGIREDITDILDHRELYFIPVVNPDGYAFNEREAPAGGGMWRKNRRQNANGSYGIDLNRNYGYAWGVDNVGSSSTPGADTYRGSAPFSEPETQAVRDFCVQKKFSLVLNYHTFGNVLIYPWGFVSRQTADSSVFRRLADGITAHNYYASGTGVETLGYATNGDADDWLYGEVLSKPVSFGFTPEVGSNDDGFWPVPSRILPLAEENLDGNLIAAQLAGQHMRITGPAIVQKRDNDTINVSFSLRNGGLRGDSSGVSVEATGDGITVVDPRNVYIAEPTRLPLAFRTIRGKGLPDGSRVRLYVTCVSAGGRSRDSLVFRVGIPDTLFADDAEAGTGKWVALGTVPSSRWDTSSIVASSGRYSFADSPRGPYGRDVVSAFALKDVIPLNCVAAELQFRARWDIEPEFDAVFVEASSDLGRSWNALPGLFTRPGSGRSGGKQPLGVPAYDRAKFEWVDEVIDLATLLNKPVQIRFSLESDAFLQRDGMYVDDIRVLAYNAVPLSVDLPPVPGQVELSQNYPNPFNAQTTIRFSIPAELPVRLQILDILGREVMTVVDEVMPAGVHSRLLGAHALASGVYYCRLEVGGLSRTRPMVLMR